MAQFIFTTLSVPYSFTKIFPGATEITVNEKYSGRSDLIIEDNFGEDAFKKLMHDEVNNTSSLQCESGDTYRILTEESITLLGKG